MASNATTASSAGGSGGGAGGGGGGSSSSSSGGSGGGGGGGPCGACKFLRRKCVAGCIFAPYFDSEQGAAHFAAVHKVFGASNVSKLLQQIPVSRRPEAVVTICYEAQARLRDPIYGCVAQIFTLQQQAELSYLQAHLAALELPTPALPPPSQPLLVQHPLSISDLPQPSSIPGNYDLSSLFEPTMHASWPPMQYQQLGVTRAPPPGGSGSGGGDLQAMASGLLRGHGSATVPCTEAPPLPPRSE
ncbi:LOB domain-containing protein 18-like isoform X2 [Diospyros lotus]|uniref:LOB domain-containing protein 18-like isoform X2 n=1 Tax=Diospyros lotus TaxID=55363 RepID=UPI0022523640|nr:LOB domain-containing protein 18-like isoform X2 [Diospyros lotus]